MAPVVVLASTFLLYVVLPAGPDAIVQNLDTGVFYAMAVSSLSVLGILMAGWASANKYALLGGLRAAGQLIAYELPLILAVMGVVIQAETLNLQDIVVAQATGEIFGFGAIGNPFILTQFIAFLIFMIAAQAELTQTPFDMPVAETELVGGFHIEYTGFRFLLFFMAEFGTAFAFAALASVMFLGGWWIPGFEVDDNILNVLGPGVMLGKILLVAFFIFWVRFTYPRLAKINSRNLPGKYSFRFPWPTSCSLEYLRWSSNASATRSNKGTRCHRSHSRTHTISEARMEKLLSQRHKRSGDGSVSA